MTDQTCHSKIGVVVFAHTPPPHHGQSYMVALLVDGFKDREPGHDLRMYHVNTRFSERLEDIGFFQPVKAARLLVYLARALWLRLRRGAEVFYYVPAPVKKMPLLRDWLVLLAARLWFKKIILHWHAGGLGEWVAGAPKTLPKSITRRIFGRLDLFISLTDSGRKHRDIFQPRQSVVIANGIPDPCPEFAENILPVRLARLRQREAGLTDSGMIFFRTLFMAHCSGEKGLFDALEAVAAANAELARRHAPVRVTLAVTGKFLTSLDQERFATRIKQPDLQISNGALSVSAVAYQGFVSGGEKERLLSDSDALLFPSRYPVEEQPVAVIEALAHGLPALVSDWRGLPELVAGTGLPAPSKTARELAENILAAMHYREFARLREIYLTRYTAAVMLEKIQRAMIAAAAAQRRG